MQRLETSLLWVSVFVLALLVSASARADVTVPTPQNWEVNDAAASQARERANQLHILLEGEILKVSSSSGQDDFAERVLAFDITAPIPPEALTDLAAAKVFMRALVTTVQGAEPRDPTSPVEFVTRPGTPTMIMGTWLKGDVSQRVLVVPKGLSHIIVVMEAKKSEMFFFKDVFDFVTQNITGAEPTILPFSTGKWRALMLLALLCVGVVSFGVVLALSDQTGNFEQAGRRAAAALAVAGFVAAGFAFLLLSGREAGLRAANISANRLAFEAMLNGLALAAVSLLVSRRFRQDSQRIQAAPDSGIYSASQTSGISPTDTFDAAESQVAGTTTTQHDSTIEGRPDTGYGAGRSS